MKRRIGLIAAVAALTLALIGVPAAAGAKKKLQPGIYNGTTSNGIVMSITLNPDRATGNFTYCEAIAVPFTLSGNAFSVSAAEGTIQISGVFQGLTKKQRKRRVKASVSGSMPLGGGCDGSAQTFILRHI